MTCPGRALPVSSSHRASRASGQQGKGQPPPHGPPSLDLLRRRRHRQHAPDVVPRRVQRLGGGFHVAHGRPRLHGERQAEGEQQHDRARSRSPARAARSPAGDAQKASMPARAIAMTVASPDRIRAASSAQAVAGHRRRRSRAGAPAWRTWRRSRRAAAGPPAAARSR